MKTGIVVALPQELATLTKKRVPRGGFLPLSEKICVCLSGVGAERARAAGQLLLKQGVDGLISWGSAAGLSPELSAGTLVIPRAVIDDHKEVFPTDMQLLKNLSAHLPEGQKISHGLLYGSVCLLDSPSRKEELFNSSQAVAADMESAALARLARENQIPFAAVRAISDTAGMVLPATIGDAIDGNGRLHIFQLIANLLLSPRDWRSLIRLASGFRKARRSLTCASQMLIHESKKGLQNSPGYFEGRVMTNIPGKDVKRGGRQ